MKNATEKWWTHNCPEEGVVDTAVGEPCNWCVAFEPNAVSELRRRADVRDQAMKEAKEFVKNNTHFSDSQTIAVFAVAEYICKQQNASLYEP